MSVDCQKALKAIRSLYVELNNLDLDTILLGELYQVCSTGCCFIIKYRNSIKKGKTNSLLVCAHIYRLQFLCIHC